MTDNITVNEQNSIRIVTESSKVIYIDPFGLTSSRNDADYIFLTHDHYDHYSIEDINKVLKQETQFIVPEKMDRSVRKSTPAGRNLAVKAGQRYTEGEIAFETVAAYNLLKPFHPKSSGWVGYILEVDGSRIYIAGDTDATPEAKAVKCDIAFVPIGGTYTMNAKAAAELVNIIKPKAAIPTHFGTIVGKPSDADEFERLVDKEISVIRKIHF